MDTEWKFKQDAKPHRSINGFWHDLTRGGFIKPEVLLDDEVQLAAVQSSIRTLEAFRQALKDAKLLNEF